MTKKKNSRQKHQKDVCDTSEEESSKTSSFQGKCCSHVPRAVNFGRVKRLLKLGNFNKCSSCTSSPVADEEADEVWLCLQCGSRGCGRLSTHQHALQHFKTIHSDCHSLVLSTSSGVVWCYDCDDEVQLESSRNLKQCVEFIMKMKVTNNNVKTEISKRPCSPTRDQDLIDPLDKELKKIVDEKKSVQPSLLETVLKEQTSINRVSSDAVSKKSDFKSNSKPSKESANKVKGLRNLGNTCYFNAVMQNLSQTQLLYQCLEDSCSAEVNWEVPQLVVAGDSVVEDENSEPLKIVLPREFQLVNNFLKFLKKMLTFQNKIDVIDPTDLFNDIQRKSPQFQYFHQQDSHELLRQFLDGIRQDEVKRQKRAILKHFNIGNTSSEIDDNVRKLIKAYGCYASHTIVEKIFGGLLISTVLCEECKMSSQVFEPFMDMSLPLFEEKQQEHNGQMCALLDGGKQQVAKCYTVLMTKEYSWSVLLFMSYENIRNVLNLCLYIFFPLLIYSIIINPMCIIKPIRGRKPEQETDENDGEYIITKSKKDYGKPSKHQEKKMKQLEKKEKRKNKKAQNTKENVKHCENSPEKQNDISKCMDISIDHETGEPNHGGSTTADSNQFKDPAGNGQCLGSKENCASKEQGTLDDVISGTARNHDVENCSTKLRKVDSSVDLRKDDESFPTNELASLESDDHNFLVLFDEIVILNHESVVEVSSPSIENDEESSRFSDKDLECEVDQGTPEDTQETATLDLADELDRSIKASSLDERMQVLSLQMTELRIRRDSDRQESILSSPQSPDDSPKTNYDDDSPDDTDDKWSHNLTESQTKEWIHKSLTTLKPRQPVSPLECSVVTCLTHFTKPELLAGNNKFRCESCSEMKRRKTGDKKAVAYSNASKQLLVFSPPAVLTLHLKRFQQVGMSLRKVNRFVEFPLILDLAPYCSSACLILPHMTSVKDEILYSLYGIVEHSGRLTSGHYTAYVKTSKRTLNKNFMNHLPLAQCDLEQLLRKFSKQSSQSEDSAEESGATEECRWFYISDCHVREVSEAQVLKCQAYLLFYERIK